MDVCAHRAVIQHLDRHVFNSFLDPFHSALGVLDRQVQFSIFEFLANLLLDFGLPGPDHGIGIAFLVALSEQGAHWRRCWIRNSHHGVLQFLLLHFDGGMDKILVDAEAPLATVLLRWRLE